MFNNKEDSKISRTLCGPYDSQFVRKFGSRDSKSLSLARLKMTKSTHLRAKGKSQSSLPGLNMLPKLKELEKIARTERKKAVKVNKYVDGVSDLELYITNKLMHKTSTREIVDQLSKDIQREGEDRN